MGKNSWEEKYRQKRGKEKKRGGIKTKTNKHTIIEQYNIIYNIELIIRDIWNNGWRERKLNKNNSNECKWVPIK